MEPRQFALYDTDGSVIRKTVEDCAPPVVAASPEGLDRLRKFLRPLIPGPGEIVILTSQGDTSGDTVRPVMLAADEILVPNDTAFGHAGVVAPDKPPSDMPASMFEGLSRNVEEVGSTSFQLTIVSHAAEWLEWGAAFAKRHRLRLQVWMSPGASIPAAFRSRAIVFKARRVVRLSDGRALSYRELGPVTLKSDQDLERVLRDGRRVRSDAEFEMSLKPFELQLRDMEPATADRVRAAMREMWRSVHGA